MVILLAAQAPVSAQSILREYWTGFTGTSLSDLLTWPDYPNRPTGATYPTLFEAPVNFADNYGTRMRGYVIPPANGTYVFWIASDNQGQLYLSTNDLPAGKQLIAWLVNYSGSREWTKETNQQSAPVTLVAGQRYYIEALQVDVNGGDNLAVGWRLASGVDDRPISGQYLAPWVVLTNAPAIVSQPQNVSTQENSLVAFQIAATGGEPLQYQWQRDGVNLDGEITATLLFERVTMDDNAANFRCLVSNPFGAVTSQVATLTVTDDISPPVLARVHPPVGLIIQQFAEVELFFNEPVTGMDAADLRINGQPATNVTGFGSGPFVFQFPPAATGLVQVAFAPDHGIRDYSPASNLFVGTSWFVLVNDTATPADVVINELVAANENGLKDEAGEYEGWIELFNRGTRPVNLRGWSLTDDREQPGQWVFPGYALGAGQRLVVFASGKDRTAPTGTNLMHTNFKLSSGGEYLGLYSPDSPRVPVSELAPKYPEQRNDISYGLNDTNQYTYFLSPTPGAANGGLTTTGIVEAPHFSAPRGFFSNSFNLRLVSPTPGATIRYTTNNSLPNEITGFLYADKIPINNTTLIRATAFKPGQLPSQTITHSYYFNQNTSIVSLPVLSLVTAENNLTGPTGIIGIGGGTYSNGIWQAVNPGDYFNPTNQGIAWERPVSAELIYPRDNSGFQIDCGLRVQGSPHIRPRYTVTSKFSYRLYFRGDYGEGELNYPFFGDSAVQNFDVMVLRAGKNDISNPFIKDELIRRLAIDMGQVHVRGTFVNLFVNGLYKGYYNPTERVEKNFCQHWHGGGDAWDVITVRSEVMDGDGVNFSAMRSYITGNSMLVPANYTAASRWLDMTNFVDYLLVNIYGATRDWPHNNWRAARERATNALWRFYIWDAEGAFGTFGQTVNENTFTNALISGTAEIQRLYQSLVPSPEFRLFFADRIQKHLFNGGALEDANVTNHFNAMRSELMGVIPSMNLSILTNWVPARRGYIFSHFPMYGLAAYTNAPVFSQHGGRVAKGFNLGMTTTAGSIYYTTNGADPRVPFTGAVSTDALLYATPLPILASLPLKARALSGTNWSALTEAEFSVGALGTQLRITEIMPNPPGGSAFEYLELMNTGAAVIDLGSLTFEGIVFKFAPFTTLAPGQTIILASDENPALFAQRYPGLAVAGWFDGTLRNEGERIAILDRRGNTICSVTYGSLPDWPAAAAGGGYSLELVDLNLDPNSPANWRASLNPNGSPGETNPPQPAPSIRIHEVMADNPGTVTNGGSFPDWVELYNPGPSPVALDAWFLADAGRSNLFIFPPGTHLGSNQFMVLWCDTATNDPGLHTGFGLNREGDTLFLFDAAASLVDALAFGAQLPGNTLGAVSNRWCLCLPTPGAANLEALTAPATNLFLNEWLANAPPARDDWVELYNRSTNLPVALRGIYLATSNDLFQLKYPAFLAPGGHIQLRADKNPGPDHLDFKISATGDALRLYDESGFLIMQSAFGPQPEGVSRGSLPDGSTNVINFTASQSPGRPNHLVTSISVYLNEVLARNTSAQTNGAGHFADWLELYNANASPVSLAGMSLSLNRPQPGEWTFPPGTVIPANGYLHIWCDPLLPASTNSLPPLNTGRGIDFESGGAYLYNTNSQLADSLEFGFQIPNQTIGRTTGGVRLLAAPTPGQANQPAATLGAATNLRINEWLANPILGDDWIELYNSAALPVELSGLFLTDDPSIAGQRRFQFGPLSFIGANGFVQVIADGQPDRGRHHADFSLDALGEALRLYSPALAMLDSADMSAPPPGYAEGRNPDGAGATFYQTSTLTPGAPNVILYPLTIITQPHSQITTNGSNATITVFALGTGPLRYEWSFNGTNLPSGTNATLLFTNAAAQHEGTYVVTITDAQNTITSDPATLLVLYRPAITRQPRSQVVTNGGSLTLEIEATGTAPITYRWRRGSLAFATGVDLPSVTVTNLQAANAGIYSVVLTNAANGSGLVSAFAFITIVTNLPVSQTVWPGSNVTFRAGAVSPATVVYQWRCNGLTLTGQVSATLTLTNAQAQHEGLYTVDFSAGGAQFTSPPAALSLVCPPVLNQPVMDGSGNLSLRVGGNLGLRHEVDATTNFHDWTNILSVVITNPTDTITLPANTNNSLRFFRLRLSP